MSVKFPAKRMRLGTKSCSECRRRKVGCKFNDGSDSCQQCVLHDTRCISQDDCAASAVASASASVPPSASASNSDDLQARMASLEASVRDLCQAISQTGINHSSLPVAALGAQSSEHEQGIGVNQDAALDEAPLIQYLRHSLATQVDTSIRSDNPSRQPCVENPIIGPTERRIRGLIPVNSTLVRIFGLSHKFWDIWPLHLARDVHSQNIHGLPTSVGDAVRFIDDSLRSSSPSILAKCLVWFCLCLQQLPPAYTTTQEFCLPMPKADLMDKCLDEIDVALFQRSSPRLGCDLDSLEVYILQAELFVNMGRPCRAWKSVRQGVDNAMLLGLHRPEQDGARLNSIWSTLWRLDRQLSMFLGLPYSVPGDLILQDERDDGIHPSLEHQIMRSVTSVCGRIVDRDQRRQQRWQEESSYTDTVSIMETMEHVRNLIPKEWYNFEHDNQPPVTPAIAFSRMSILLHFHFTNKLLHLPYVLLAAHDRKYEHSRFLALESAEAMVQTYLRLRDLIEDNFACDFLDFIAFSGGIVLAADLSKRGQEKMLTVDDERIWELLRQLSSRLGRTAEELGCSVATQAAEVLKNLYSISQGEYDGPDCHEIMIPYFGIMRIRAPTALGQRHFQAWRKVSFSSDPNMVDFSTDMFSFRFPSELQTAEELGQDWEDLVANPMYDSNGYFR
uniref:Zn(2)-C6 fungal-type domain-containing protein n=1 Tax=Bionectria ochroleuca TaxID=29856 RepID=A0A8H7TVT5_BIOOC